MMIIKVLDLSNQVIYLGFKPNPYPFIKHAKLFVLSSVLEGFSCVLSEACALNVPIVSTACKSGPDKLVDDAYRHCLTPVNDVDALATNISRISGSQTLYAAPLREEFQFDGLSLDIWH